ncbi:MAG TPA: TniQ family protein [Anaerolineales bacterium]|nr:TniQ family protein [Anaerolineales bacterium]
MVLLPIKVAPYRDELFSSWVVRLANENAMKASALLTHVGFERQAQTDFDLSPHSDLVASLASVGLSFGNADRLQRATITSWGEKAGSLRQCMRRWVLPAGFRHSRIRFCPLCLKERAYFRKAWRLNWYGACHRHRVILSDHCHACLSPQALYRTSWRHGLGCCTNCNEPLKNAPVTAPFDDAAYWHSVAVSLNQLRATTPPKTASAWFQTVWVLRKWLEKLRDDGKPFNMYMSESLEALQLNFPSAVAFHQARILWDEEPFALQKLIREFPFEFDRITYHYCPRPLKRYRRPKDWRIPSIEELEMIIRHLRSHGEDVTYFRISEISGYAYETLRKYEHLDALVKQHVCQASKWRMRS